MTKKWRDLYGAISPERRSSIEAGVAKDLAEMPLAEVRRARELTQQQIAKKLDVNQAWVSKVERQMDMYVSTLRSYVEAMGGELEIVARFREGAVLLRQFGEQEEAAETQNRVAVVPPISAGTSTPNVRVWSPQAPSIASHVAEPRARVWETAETNTPARTPGSRTPGSRTPERRLTSMVA